ncbi:hypothetical protein [Sorangium sp. So ce1000]|uniref:hypothetical protein n=1 Tax=Sorangium sp. So ce1000 TaxID=3133325 RepID=UPI003F5F263C
MTTRAIAILAAVALLLLGGCAAGVQDVGQQDLRAAAAEPSEALTRASVLLEEVHAALDALHRDAAERARLEAPDEEAAHKAIDAVHARFLPAWDAYDRARALYLAAAAIVYAAGLAELAGRAPDTGRIATAVVALMSACDALSRAAVAVGVPAPGKAGS